MSERKGLPNRSWTNKDDNALLIKDQMFVALKRENEKLNECIRLIKIAASSQHGVLQKKGILKLIEALDGGET